jgi:hypothetical protein
LSLSLKTLTLLSTRWHNYTLTKAITLNICSYVDTKLRLDKSPLNRISRLPLLDYALTIGHPDGNFSLEMANPNQNKAWQRLLEWTHAKNCSRGSFTHPAPNCELARCASLFKLLLQYGADPYSTCRYPDSNSSKGVAALPSITVAEVIWDVFADRLPYEAGRLNYLLEKQMEIHD